MQCVCAHVCFSLVVVRTHTHPMQINEAPKSLDDADALRVFGIGAADTKNGTTNGGLNGDGNGVACGIPSQPAMSGSDLLQESQSLPPPTVVNSDFTVDVGLSAPTVVMQPSNGVVMNPQQQQQQQRAGPDASAIEIATRVQRSAGSGTNATTRLKSRLSNESLQQPNDSNLNGNAAPAGARGRDPTPTAIAARPQSGPVRGRGATGSGGGVPEDPSGGCGSNSNLGVF